VGAFRGLALAAGDPAVAFLEKCLTGGERAGQLAALQLVRDADGRQVVDNRLVARLERLWPALRLAIGARLVPDEPEKKDKEP
jgi:hypothetical protein